MINPKFLTTEVQNQLRDHFNSPPPQSVTLQEFFDDQVLNRMKEIVIEQNYSRSVAHLSHRYNMAELPNYLRTLFADNTLLDFISTIIDQEVKSIKGKILKMNWKDYTILHDETIPDPGYDFIIDLTSSWNKEYGGLLTYTDGHGNISEILPIFGSVSIINRTQGIYHYIKYINHHAQQLSRYIVLAELALER